MKQKDLILVVGIVLLSGVVSFFVTRPLFASEKGNLKAEVVQPITAVFEEPDKSYFNEKAFDPTQQITIGKSDGTDPFSGKSSN